MSTLIKRKIDLVLPSAFASTGIAKPGHELVNLKALGILPGIGGGALPAEKGYNAAEDLVTQTVDGVDLNDLWVEFQQSMQEQNRLRQTLVDFLTFPVTNPIDRVAQISTADFEEASEYGEPVGVRPATAYYNLGYDFKWYDLAARFTWKFLAEAPASQVEAINAMAIEGDNRKIFNKVMNALFNNTNREADINGVQDVPVYALFNADGTVPPPYKSNTFDGTHSHYMVSGTAAITSQDLDDLYDNVAEHGYDWENGMQHVLLANSAEVDRIRAFRIALGDKWDFIPSQGSPGILFAETQQILGASQVPNNIQGLQVMGNYGPILVVQEDAIPPKYLALIATGGKANLNNPVGLREHVNTGLRGLRLVKGANPDYPLIDSFYQRGFGTGIRQRGGSAIMQVKTTGSYAPPTFA